jgi:hypothetical protein
VLNLSPLKLLIVLIVALLVVGPDRIPEISKQLGAGWRTLRGLSSRIEAEVRSNVPDLPSTGDLARYARSPLSFLDKLADLEEPGLKPDPGTVEAAAPGEGLVPDPGAPPSEPEAAARPRPPTRSVPGVDPNMN